MTPNQFSSNNFWNHIKRFAKIAGKKVLVQALTLYYTFMDPKTPWWAKAVILPSLTYFIWPLDALPDPVFVDDAGVMAAALATIAVCITPEIKAKAEKKADEILGLK